MVFSWLLIIFSLASSWLSHYHLAVSLARPTCYAKARHREMRAAEQCDWMQRSTRGKCSINDAWQGHFTCLSTATTAAFPKRSSRSAFALFRSGSEERLLQLKLRGNSAGRSVITWVGILAENPNLFRSLNRNKCCAVTMERLRTAFGSHAALKYNTHTHKRASHGAGLVLHNYQSVLHWLQPPSQWLPF